MLTRFPDEYDDAANHTRSGNTEQYFNRGWCFCESSGAMLTKSCLSLVDLGRSTRAETCYFCDWGCARSLVTTCAAGRRAPVLPNAFNMQLQSKGFTNGKDDWPRVAELYRLAFAQRFEATEKLNYEGLQWGDEEAQQLAAVLASGAAPRLRELCLEGNRVGDEGAARLAEALRSPGALPQLQVLYLSANRVGDEEALRAPDALHQLRKVSLGNNRVGDEGAARLAEALRAPGALPQLQAWGNPLDGPGWAALRAAWAEAGRPGGLWLD
ncbi:unnamed protein product [Prorocentrum cordatum]|uniref:Uncharacterized protein n=1 Tax=Prorocentrum cordatum TaxID=2364126 RepID=A0ABN9T5M1_9DINO|nr:unnamed protein product [Polarella glacialis]